MPEHPVDNLRGTVGSGAGDEIFVSVKFAHKSSRRRRTNGSRRRRGGGRRVERRRRRWSGVFSRDVEGRGDPSADYPRGSRGAAATRPHFRSAAAPSRGVGRATPPRADGPRAPDTLRKNRWDAPATLVGEGDVDAVEFASDKVLVKAHKGSKRFDLEIETLRDIDPDASSWVAASVGRMTLTLRKAAAQKEWWPRLNKGKTKPSNQGVWWDKQELYDAEKEEVQKNEKADAPPRGLAAKLAAKKKAGGSAPAAAEKDDYDDVGGLLQEAPDEETEDKPERAPLTEAVKRAEKRRQLAAKAAKKEKEKVAEDGRAAAAQAQVQAPRRDRKTP